MPIELKHATKKQLSPGRHWPLGATPEAGGVNFALYTKHAREVFLLLFDAPDGEPTDVIRMPARDKFTWHVFVHGAKAGQLYGFKVRGEWFPEWGLRFNEHKLLLDPYAKAVSHKYTNPDNLLIGYDAGSPYKDLVQDTRDNTRIVPKAVVVDDAAFDWQGDAPPAIPLEKLVVYEVHVKGFTAHRSAGVKSPGTYLGFAEKAAHLRRLGVNAVELLPIHEYYVEDFLLAKGLTNYWGYNTVGFFAPESSYAAGRQPGAQVNEFKTMVRELHKAGIEVILDVVYNHTCEGNELGPTIFLKGIDNPSYYSLSGAEGQPMRYYMNYTGCGNSVNLGSPAALRLVMDSLRYWVEEMHVDGFRFDLAAVLGREGGSFQGGSAFFDAVSQDPVLARVKLIAEPWDLGTYQVGNFPVDWSEWNGRFRDTVRRFVKGDDGTLRDFATRLTGSADMYGDDGRSAYASVNFVTCHDGFTLYDLVAYNGKHNEANLENNNDGANDNNSWNCGWEGESTDPAVNELRRRQARNYLAALLVSAGTPMLLGGDEFLRSQRGNNNAYCQDNELSWFDWDAVKANDDTVEFTARLIALVRRFPILQRRRFFAGVDTNDNGIPDLAWFGPEGGQPDWMNPQAKTVCLQLDGSEETSAEGDYVLYVIFNADWRVQYCRLPQFAGKSWRRLLDTSLPAGQEIAPPGKEVALEPQDHYMANSHSTVILMAR